MYGLDVYSTCPTPTCVRCMNKKAETRLPLTCCLRSIASVQQSQASWGMPRHTWHTPWIHHWVWVPVVGEQGHGSSRAGISNVPIISNTLKMLSSGKERGGDLGFHPSSCHHLPPLEQKYSFSTVGNRGKRAIFL
jgi:hypothetical protein